MFSSYRKFYNQIFSLVNRIEIETKVIFDIYLGILHDLRNNCCFDG